MNDGNARGAMLIRQGVQCGRREDLESGILCLVEGLSLLDGRADRRLVLCAMHNLALLMANRGLTVLARAVVVRARPLYHQVGDRVMFARLLWLEGTIARKAGQRHHAAELLEKARTAFRVLDPPQAAFIAEELAEMATEDAALALEPAHGTTEGARHAGAA